MQPEPLPKKLYNRLIAAGIYGLTLSFSGGSDEGCLEISFDGPHSCELEQAVEAWVWRVYTYSGAGDGNDYGDDIHYNLTDMVVTHSEWAMQRHDDEDVTEAFDLVDDGEEEEEPAEVTETQAWKAKLQELRDELSNTDTARALSILDELEEMVEE